MAGEGEGHGRAETIDAHIASREREYVHSFFVNYFCINFLYILLAKAKRSNTHHRLYDPVRGARPSLVPVRVRKYWRAKPTTKRGFWVR